MGKVCPKCGKENRDSAKFCIGCGNELTCNEKIHSKFSESQNDANSTKNENDGEAENISKSDISNIDGLEIAKDDIQGLNTSPKTKNKKGIWIICLLIILLVIIKFIGALSSAPKDEYIFSAARTLISEQLISPSTAVYSNEKILDKDDYGRYIVYVCVDSQNGFGSQIRNEYAVVVFSVTKENFQYNPLSSYISSNSNGTDVQSDYALDMLKGLNDWNEPLEEE
ncbi:zinc ribbon domain-containing protein [Extibacter muris]|uniref:zinc ribbon domain-containing protein n=1 Tax=Extibacter muris TaxID=1796622 RepID=UPI001D075DCE|nr:zinc ribbon domain-containing protein [Extibacter muris]MCB6201074.1 zinc ribbon domain-containing protein [Extibacter muris]MCQ4662404.1 zinc ribbon domain-containing protein [Extibacter muris]MCQ4691669.1 zinc ribbon domain-containing protein [Extibacter muris]